MLLNLCTNCHRERKEKLEDNGELRKQNKRRKLKRLAAVENFMAGTTPPQSPEDIVVDPEYVSPGNSSSTEPPETPHLPAPKNCTQRRRGRKKVAKTRAKVYRDLYATTAKLEDAVRKV